MESAKNKVVARRCSHLKVLLRTSHPGTPASLQSCSVRTHFDERVRRTMFSPKSYPNILLLLVCPTALRPLASKVAPSHALEESGRFRCGEVRWP